jgi:3-hydroxymyristoyl/3-hydroxydecanoyl-(acyl carrier protein) dehydratase
VELSYDRESDVRARVTVPASFPYFRGHFDGMPMVPAVVQLTALVLPLVRERFPGCGALVSMRRLRFRRPILPGETVTIDIAGDAPEDVRFELTVGAARVASGALTFAA